MHFLCTLALIAPILGSPIQASPSQQTGAQQVPEPVVYAIIVGVTKYADGNATNAATGARRVADFIATTYKNSTVVLLVNETATLEKVNQALLHLQDLPKSSLAFIYFAGHAERRPENSDTDVELFMRLTPTDPENPSGACLPSDSLWSAVKRARGTNVLVFLDCCFAGAAGKPAVAPRIEASDNCIKCFAIAACTKDQSAIGTYFLDALSAVWEKHKGTCLTPKQLGIEVGDEVQKRSKSLMDARCCFETGLMRCIAGLREPAFLAHVTFENAQPGQVFDIAWEQVDEASKPSSSELLEKFTFSADDPCYMRQISASHSMKLRVRDLHDATLADYVLNPKEHATPFISITVDARDRARGSESAEETRQREVACARSLEKLARGIHAIGVAPDVAAANYQSAAERWVAAARPDKATEALSQAMQLTPSDLALRLAFADSLPTADREHLYSESAQSERADVLCDRLRAWGKAFESARFGNYLAMHSNKEDIVGLLGSALSLVRTESKPVELAEAIKVFKSLNVVMGAVNESTIAGLSVPPWQKAMLSLAESAKPSDYQRVWAQLPNSESEWLAATIDPAGSRIGSCAMMGLIKPSGVLSTARAINLLGRQDISILCGKESKFRIHTVSAPSVLCSYCVARRNDPVRLDSAELQVKVRVDDSMQVCAADLATVREFLATKPGFDIEYSGDEIHVLPSEGAHGSTAVLHRMRAKLAGNVVSIIAQDRDSCLKYLLSKPGFRVQLDNGVAKVTWASDPYPQHWEGSVSGEIPAAGESVRIMCSNQSVLQQYLLAPILGPR